MMLFPKKIFFCFLIFLLFKVHCQEIVLRPHKGEKRFFMPVNHQWQILKSLHLNIDVQKKCIAGEPVKFLNKPKKIEPIRGDGNCFFNSLSQWITGAQDEGGLLRILIVYSMKMSPRFQTMLSKLEQEKHVQEMLEYTTYAEFHELFAAAEFLETSLYVYSENSWHYISKNGLGSHELLEPCIYLHHVNNNHYEVITDVFEYEENPDPPKTQVVRETQVSDYTNSIVNQIQNYSVEFNIDAKEKYQINNRKGKDVYIEPQSTVKLNKNNRKGKSIQVESKTIVENTKNDREGEVINNEKITIECKKDSDENELYVNKLQPIIDHKKVDEKEKCLCTNFVNYNPVTIEEVFNQTYEFKDHQIDLSGSRYFIPVTHQWQFAKCYDFNFQLIKSVMGEDEEIVKFLGVPLKQKKMPKNDYSFYSALSYWISGSTIYAKKLQLHINAQMEDSNDPELRAFAAARLLKTSIYIHSNSDWQFFSKDGIYGEETIQTCLYISSSDGEYYKVVTNVLA
ncbi:uncharacterized protein LOC126896149 isoform X2 [Daktulosphaira vitifoliae]|uniref:uncharacterized protein LOC126896149 isoform X2 n=1 Tax=Daktulosphaira vitifoliae TaxID=58002 RepID=UPI0021AA8AA6|nr:uncharacterized protein LOC126896149 isoform X2 [Daktulosphaira vitifoliae]